MANLEPGEGVSTSHVIDEVDLSDEQTPSGQLVGGTKEVDREARRDWVRAVLAVSLVALLIATVLWSLWFVTAEEDPVEDLIQVLQLVFTPIVGLVGSAVGFYFGASGRIDTQSRE